jgi:hypothetical protein
MTANSELLPFELITHLVRFGRIAEVTIKGAKGPQLAHGRRIEEGDVEGF